MNGLPSSDVHKNCVKTILYHWIHGSMWQSQLLLFSNSVITSPTHSDKESQKLYCSASGQLAHPYMPYICVRDIRWYPATNETYTMDFVLHVIVRLETSGNSCDRQLISPPVVKRSDPPQFEFFSPACQGGFFLIAWLANFVNKI